MNNINRYLIFPVVVVPVVVGCQPAPPPATAPVEEAKPEVAILGTYKGEYSAKQKARWKEQNLVSAEVSIILQADGRFRADSQFMGYEQTNHFWDFGNAVRGKMATPLKP